MFSKLKKRVEELEIDSYSNDVLLEDFSNDISYLKGEAKAVKSKTDKLGNRLAKVEDRLNLLEVGELRDLLNVEKISDSVINNEKTLNETLELAGEGHQAIHKIITALMDYLKVDFNEDGKLVKHK